MAPTKYEMSLAVMNQCQSFTSLPHHTEPLVLNYPDAAAAAASADRTDCWMLPCCRKLRLSFYTDKRDSNEENEQEDFGNYGPRGEALWGELFVTLEELSGLVGNQWMVSHCDINCVGSMPPFPRGFVLRGGRIENTLILFKPKKTVELPFGVNPEARSYRLKVRGDIKGTKVYGAVNVRFEDQSTGGIHMSPHNDQDCQGVAAMGRGRFLTEIKDLFLSNAQDWETFKPPKVLYHESNNDTQGRQRLELREGSWRHVL
jgi:hypothetical protein